MEQKFVTHLNFILEILGKSENEKDSEEILTCAFVS